MSLLSDASNFILFYLKAKTVYRLHSPFLFELVTAILDKKQFYDFDLIEKERVQLLKDHRPITLEDLGAGSKKIRTEKITHAGLAKSSLSTAWQCRIMYRLVNKLSPKNILELGTSLGISTAYLAMASSNAEVKTMEGNQATLTAAKKLFKKLKIKNIEGVLGNFDQLLPEYCRQTNQLDLAFLDGNHRYAATVDYFNQLLAISGNNTVFIIDDIYWSREMTQAWEEIKAHKRVSASLDFYLFGLVFLDDRFKEEKHLKIVSKKFKPWQKFF